jgi:Family of unknown function (DUF5752)
MVPRVAEHPFEFSTRLTLTKLTGRRAWDLAGLLEHLRTVPLSVVFHHTHHFLVQHQHLSPEPPNDFAYWVTNVLQESLLGERLAAIDTVRFAHLRELRDRLVSVIESYLEQAHDLRVAPAGEEFHFMDAVSFTFPTHHRAATLAEFAEQLKMVGAGSIAFHLFEARLRVESGDNDFSRWLEEQLDERELAQAIRRLDPYTITTEGLRQRLLGLIAPRLEVA